MENFLTVAVTLAKIGAIITPLLLAVAYLTYAERKIIGYIQVRIGPNRVGFLGILQPFADILKLITKEIVIVFCLSLRLRSPLGQLWPHGQLSRLIMG